MARPKDASGWAPFFSGIFRNLSSYLRAIPGLSPRDAAEVVEDSDLFGTKAKNNLQLGLPMENLRLEHPWTLRR